MAHARCAETSKVTLSLKARLDPITASRLQAHMCSEAFVRPSFCRAGGLIPSNIPNCTRAAGRRAPAAPPFEEDSMNLMFRSPSAWLATFAAALLLGHAGGAFADSLQTKLSGYSEAPAVSSAASGRFKAKLDKQAGALTYELSYEGLEGPVRMAHIHIGQRGVNGGIMVWLCQTASFVDPTGLAPICPVSGTVRGVIQAANVLAVGAQGVDAMSFDELLDAIRASVAYVNVHSDRFPGGELRGQIGYDD